MSGQIVNISNNEAISEVSLKRGDSLAFISKSVTTTEFTVFANIIKEYTDAIGTGVLP